MKRKMTFNMCLLYFFFAFFLLSGISAFGGEFGLGGGSGSQPGVLTVSEDKELPAISSEAQALRGGHEVVRDTKEVLGDTGKPGLGGDSGSQPLFLPVPEDKEATTNKRTEVK